MRNNLDMLNPPVMFKSVYTWKVFDDGSFFSITKSGDRLTSPSFSDPQCDDIKWRLLLYPKGLSDELNDYVGLSVTCESSEYVVVSNSSKIECSIVADETHSLYSTIDQGTCLIYGNNTRCNFFPNFIKYKTLLGWLEKYRDGSVAPAVGNVVLNCKVEILGSMFPRIDCQLNEDIGRLFDTENLSDVELNVDGQIFHAHKVILAARSTVFAAMFEHEMAEKIENAVTIVDIDSKVFREILRYIYTGKVKNLEEVAFDLLTAADKYDLRKLKILCEMFIYNATLTKDNVMDLLILADVQRSGHLKTKAIEFINANAIDVMETEGYKALVNSHPHLLDECYRAMAIKLERNGATNEITDNGTGFYMSELVGAAGRG